MMGTPAVYILLFYLTNSCIRNILLLSKKELQINGRN